MTNLSRPLHPVLLANHPRVAIGARLLSPKADPQIVLIRAYHHLVTLHNVDPADAKKLLGLTE